MEYIISGHSSHTKNLFAVPRNITLRFYAQEGETCYIPSDQETIEVVIGEIQDTGKTYGNTYIYGDRARNYNISFEYNNYQGVFEYANHNLRMIHNLPTTLKDTCELLRNINEPNTPITVYCLFCRGSEPDQFRKNTALLESVASDDLDMLNDPELSELLDAMKAPLPPPIMLITESSGTEKSSSTEKSKSSKRKSTPKPKKAKTRKLKHATQKPNSKRVVHKTPSKIHKLTRTTNKKLNK